jgi:hypothetical protein
MPSEQQHRDQTGPARPQVKSGMLGLATIVVRVAAPSRDRILN